MNHYDVITIGSATVDVFANTSSQLVKLVTANGEEDFITYPSGSKILIKEINFLVGGGGTNTAASFSKLGLETAYLGKLGDDENASKVVSVLDDYGVDFIGSKKGQTGYSIILDSIEHDRTILTFKGSNNNLRTKDVDLSFLNTKWIYSSSMVGTSYETLKVIFEYAKNKGIKLAFNPSEYQAKLGYEQLKDVLELVDVLVLNLEEAQLLLGMFSASAKELAVALSTGDKDYVVVTDGKNGSTAYHNGFVYQITPTKDANVLETTGAGDAFASGFVAGLLKELTIEEALKMGAVQSESVISSHGAKEKLLDLDSVKEKINIYSGEIIKEKAEPTAHPYQGLEHHLPDFTIAPDTKEFHLEDGKKIKSIEELTYFLKYASKDRVKKYFGVNFNYFADWIDDVFEEKTLANDLRKSSDKDQIANILFKFVEVKN